MSHLTTSRAWACTWCRNSAGGSRRKRERASRSPRAATLRRHAKLCHDLRQQLKTVNVRLSPETGPIYQAASQQYRKLEALLSRLEKLSRTVLAALAKQAARKVPGR